MKELQWIFKNSKQLHDINETKLRTEHAMKCKRFFITSGNLNLKRKNR